MSRTWTCKIPPLTDAPTDQSPWVILKPCLKVRRLNEPFTGRLHVFREIVLPSRKIIEVWSSLYEPVEDFLSRWHSRSGRYSALSTPRDPHTYKCSYRQARSECSAHCRLRHHGSSSPHRHRYNSKYAGIPKPSDDGCRRLAELVVTFMCFRLKTFWNTCVKQLQPTSKGQLVPLANHD